MFGQSPLMVTPAGIAPSDNSLLPPNSSIEEDIKAAVPTPVSSNSLTQYTQLLPESFELTDAWRIRLFDITRLPDSPQDEHLGICGSCMLHSIEMLLNFHYFQTKAPPRTAKGHLFAIYKTQSSALRQLRKSAPEIFVSVTKQTRKFEIQGECRRAWNCSIHDYNPNAHRTFYPQCLQITMKSLLEKHEIETRLIATFRPPVIRPFSSPFTTASLVQDDIADLLRCLCMQPIGTVWLFTKTYGYIDKKGKYLSDGHTFLVIKNKDGLGLIETNISSMSLGHYCYLLDKRITNTSTLFQCLEGKHLSPDNKHKLYSLDIFQIMRPSP